MRHAYREIRLLVEVETIADRPEASSLKSSPSESGNGPRFESIAVPSGLSFLTWGNGRQPRLSTRPPDSQGEMLVLEPVFRGRHPRLLMVNSGGGGVRVNGHPAPCVVPLDEKDQLQLDGGAAIHVSLFDHPYLGRPPEEYIGKECPICRVPFVADTTIWICPCGGSMHCEGEEKSEKDRLECVLLSSECKSCGGPIRMREGLSYIPEELCDA